MTFDTQNILLKRPQCSETFKNYQGKIQFPEYLWIFWAFFFLDLTGRSWWWCFKFFKPLKLNWIFPSGTWTKERRLPILKSRSTLRTCKYASFNFDEKIMQEFFASKVSFLLELKKKITSFNLWKSVSHGSKHFRRITKYKTLILTKSTMLFDWHKTVPLFAKQFINPKGLFSYLKN